jgi:hypothetical protein
MEKRTQDKPEFSRGCQQNTELSSLVRFLKLLDSNISSLCGLGGFDAWYSSRSIQQVEKLQVQQHS